ncbi:putative AlkP superfamily pyrophosphatase or phosphodiesterase [Algoriphagus ratkowskyi]|uniref:Alkaline phosphatase family protein n=1 Tax=Algoriphagus ratkowskyi TaxID=57028 RepID=A0A2W7R2A7_9BACT|nr:alkaline phosphatase family protein [Algoriphagus ratkowskyi]PZX54674.1 putative AlkP superfamily pyrophosphatase or phosphodiesterase [Algoriphagus ratkowskyi]TXD76986.1 alkaline phosphatase family protein [Algoriphagus ratkowskyi]
MKKIVLVTFLAFSLTPIFAQINAKKVLFVILDGIPADVIDTVSTPNIDKIIAEGGFAIASMGGEVGAYSETPTISAVGYNSLLTGVWANKHNVWDNDIEAPNYNYWTIFRMLKEADPSKKTAIYSTWLDNRTKLVGVNLAETGDFIFDYFFDGLELDSLNFPHGEDKEYIHQIDEAVSKEAARHIRKEGPDLSWMYLQYSDDMGHAYGNSPQMIEGLQKADVQIGRVWEAVQFREKSFKEDWLIVITTDHGRELDGFGHGGQSDRERRIWIVTNAKMTNQHFQQVPAMVDILPSMAYHLGIKIPKKIAMELDGTPFIGPVDATDLKAELKNGEISMNWQSLSKGQKGRVWVSTTNDFKTGGLDNYWLVGEVNLEDGQKTFSLNGTQSKIFKVVLETPSGYLNYWVEK